MMRIVIGLASLALGLCIVSLASASGAKPTIQITNLRNGEVIYGSRLTVHVAVSNFKLVPPVLLPASGWKTIPLLKGNQGHIHYVLDGMSNLVLTRDVVVRTSHTWTHVAPGWHTVIAYLATSQHAQFPGTRAATVSVRIEPRPVATGPIPSIRITNVRTMASSGSVAVVVHVTVSHFKLVPPVYKNPPLLPGKQGHIHYVLDSLANFQATRDAVTALSHPWAHVSRGWHTIIAYLATSQHQLFPGTKPATIRVYVPARAQRITVNSLPTTGGARPGTGWLAWLAGVGLLVGGAALFRVRSRAGEIG